LQNAVVDDAHKDLLGLVDAVAEEFMLWLDRTMTEGKNIGC
jgi:hypothetical protein